MENSIDKDAANLFSNAMEKDFRPPTRKIHHDKKKNKTRLDLHHMTVPAALTKLQAFIQYAKNSGQKTMIVVTGSGRHSPGIGSPLQSNVENYLKQNGVQFEYKQGVFTICL